MGHGNWRDNDFREYSRRAGRRIRRDGTVDLSGYRNVRDMYQEKGLCRDLDPRGVMRECCETPEHPDTLPVILALDVTGSMGRAAMEVAGKLGEVMREVLGFGKDIEFMIMGIGDLDYDRAPIQISQFESDIRIAGQLDKIYFEGGGGGNRWESYTGAWYMAARHTVLDCWKSGRRGLLITMGDEPLNPVLPGKILGEVTGDSLQGDVRTDRLYREVLQKYAVYHINVEHGHSETFRRAAMDAWSRILDRRHLMECSVEGISQAIVRIILDELAEREEGPAGTARPLLPVYGMEEKRETEEREETASHYGFGGILRRGRRRFR